MVCGVWSQVGCSSALVLSKMEPRGTDMVQNVALEGPKWSKMEPGRCAGGPLEAQIGQKTEKRGQVRNAP